MINKREVIKYRDEKMILLPENDYSVFLRVWRLAKTLRCRHICVCLSPRNYFESYAHARELNIQSHTANCPTRLVTLAHNRSSSHLLSHLPRDTSTYGHQQYRSIRYRLILGVQKNWYSS
ncbi:hypothetical protein NQ318_006546 [Aromia moschata]|uniref:Uncharacterized protein n=1 Tax=Aromia moschata TaxID=1265417 RepID=A0AAV8YQP4_9CUCU|nr:hypothetical protein NQ318_006546 [Aromia moschata]